jgi:zinc/manganese transport system permease protein
MDMLELLFWPFVACLVLTGIHCYLGIHVVGRGVIFVDLAMAQIAFLGSAAAFFVLHVVLGPQHLPPPPSFGVPVAPVASMTEQARDLATAVEPITDEDAPITEETVDALIPPDVPSPGLRVRQRTRHRGEKFEQLIPPERPPSTPSERESLPDDTTLHRHESAATSSPTVHPEDDSREQLRSRLEHAAPYVGGILFTLLGAAVFSLGRFRHRHIPQEAIIGIVYAVSMAATMILLYKAPHDIAEQTRGMLMGRILFVHPVAVTETAALYAVIGLLHYFCRRPFLMISFQPDLAEARRVRIRAWDFLFYATFGVIVTSSVQMAGVLLVFCYLIVPSVCAILFFHGILKRLLFGWAIGFLGSVLGLTLAVFWDSPPGGSIVVAFGGILILLVILRAVYMSPRLGWPIGCISIALGLILTVIWGAPVVGSIVMGFGAASILMAVFLSVKTPRAQE